MSYTVLRQLLFHYLIYLEKVRVYLYHDHSVLNLLPMSVGCWSQMLVPSDFSNPFGNKSGKGLKVEAIYQQMILSPKPGMVEITSLQGWTLTGAQSPKILGRVPKF